MIVKLIGALLLCGAPFVSNRTDEWNSTDQWTVKRAVKVCRFRYAPQNPCLKLFIKKAPGNYNAVCGPPGDSEGLEELK